MSTERDELAEDIRGLGITVIDGPPVDLSEPLAQHLHSLGYRKPRTVTTVEELDALTLPAIINAKNGGPARVDYYYGPSRRKYVEYIFGEDDRDYSLEAFAEFMDGATVLCEAS
ncbi:hypothetical protein J2T10_001964 [Paenarthrobacter nicotinovorans]|uniref:Uncharacterized protein n=1 Tax=Paenarthrobacter nicotinovorans TaxID=29320 RepID=A0ABT9TKZ0_PAENI|nr:hypothetical protein [Paenarthrobacter nicotinovorans]MDQ0102318.1 hypothetical protein [Paenarthrobacter nicotinovorans]